MPDIKIDKGVVRTPHIEPSIYSHLANDLEIGDSFVVKNRNERSKFWQSLSRHGLKLMSRKLPDGTFRIWCIGKPCGGDHA